MNDPRLARLVEAARVGERPPPGALDRGWRRLEASIALGEAGPPLPSAPPAVGGAIAGAAGRSAPARWIQRIHWIHWIRWIGAGAAISALAVALASAFGPSAGATRRPVISITSDDQAVGSQIVVEPERDAEAPRFVAVIPLAATTRETPLEREVEERVDRVRGAATGADSTRSRPRGRRVTGAAPAASVTGGDELAAELALMGRVRDAMRRGANERAQALLDRHARDFPQGVFADERELSRITVACRRGDRARAEGVAAAFARVHAGSSSASRRLETCTEHAQ